MLPAIADSIYLYTFINMPTTQHIANYVLVIQLLISGFIHIFSIIIYKFP
jgi:hypothetical protein